MGANVATSAAPKRSEEPPQPEAANSSFVLLFAYECFFHWPPSQAPGATASTSASNSRGRRHDNFAWL